MITVAPDNFKTIRPANRWLDIFIWLYIITILFFSVYYAQERIIAYDTAGYMVEIIRANGFYIATNRFISTLAQVLPIAGMKLGISLKGLIILYSLNFSLIPIFCSLIARYLLKNKEIAIAILLFYSILNARLFFYPVSEFQMGLCLLLLYHGLMQNWINKHISCWKIAIWSLPFIITIVFSHPLSLVVLIAWCVYFISFKEYRKWIIALPILCSILTYFIKEKWFKALVGTFDYEQDKINNLNNFLDSFSSHLSSTLAATSWKEYTDHYFMVFVLLGCTLYTLLRQRRWLSLALYPCIIGAFWLLVTVSFKNMTYNFYPEHMYQPLGFFIALGFGYTLVQITIHKLLKISILSITSIIAFAKINNGAKHNHSKIEFYKPYIQFLRARGIKKAALRRAFVPGNFDSYWAGHCESLLISAQDGPDSAIVLYLHYSPKLFTHSDPSNEFDNKDYIRIIKSEKAILVDSIATASQIDSLNKISNHIPNH
jgi:hypothetical protein